MISANNDNVKRLGFLDLLHRSFTNFLYQLLMVQMRYSEIEIFVKVLWLDN